MRVSNYSLILSLSFTDVFDRAVALLHLPASVLGADVVRLLAEQEAIDNTLRDTQGKIGVHVACKDAASAVEGNHNPL